MGRPLLFNSVEELENKINAYFDSCFDYLRNGFGVRVQEKIPDGHTKSGKPKYKPGEFIRIQVKPFTVSGLAVFLNTSRETLMNYEEREEYFDTIKRAKDIIYAYNEERLYTANPTGAIFSLKHNYGWKDKHELSIEGDISLKDIPSDNLEKIEKLLDDKKDS